MADTSTLAVLAWFKRRTPKSTVDRERFAKLGQEQQPSSDGFATLGQEQQPSSKGFATLGQEQQPPH